MTSAAVVILVPSGKTMPSPMASRTVARIAEVEETTLLNRKSPFFVSNSKLQNGVVATGALDSEGLVQRGAEELILLLPFKVVGVDQSDGEDQADEEDERRRLHHPPEEDVFWIRLDFPSSWAARSHSARLGLFKIAAQAAKHGL
eukprot:scaffold7358_cov252-Pinguiococcus_pyrenoidosus.AAC.2